MSQRDVHRDEVIAIERLLGSSFAENATLRHEVERLHAQAID